MGADGGVLLSDRKFGGADALAAGRALKKHAGDHLSAKEIAEAALTTAADICVFTNHNIILEAL